MLRLRTFGGLEVTRDRVTLTGAATQRRPLALLAIVAASPHGCTREDLLLHLWPDSTPERARNVLRQTIYALRRDLGTHDLFLGEHQLLLNSAVISSDVGEFENALEGGDQARAVELYGGPFLDGFHLRESPEFEAWREREVARITGRFLQALRALAQSTTDHEHAIDRWRRMATTDPLDPIAAEGLIDALAALGDRDAALQHARIYELLVQQQSAAPDSAVLQAAARVRATGSQSPAALDEPILAVNASATPLDHSASSSAAANSRSVTPRMRPSWWKVPWLWVAAGAVCVAIIYFAVRMRSAEEHDRKSLDADLVLVAPFGVFDPELQLWREGLVDVLAREIDGAGSFRTVAPGVAVRRLKGESDQSSAADLAREIGAGIAVSGHLLRAGRDSVRVSASVTDARTGAVLGETERAEALIHMDRLTDSVALAVFRILQTRDGAEGGLTPSMGLAGSLEALKAFLHGEQSFRRAQWDSARVYYEAAVREDTAFALAYHRIGQVIGWQRIAADSLASTYLLRAGALNQGLGPRDSLLVLADSLQAAANMSSDPSAEWRYARRAFATLTEAARRYPESPAVWFELGEAGYHLGTGPQIGIPESEVLQSFDRSIALDSAFSPAYIHPVELGFNLGGEAEGLRYAHAYLKLHPTEHAHRGVRLILQIIGPDALPRTERARLLDTISTDAVVSARTMLRRWPDSAETAVMLSRLLAQGRPSTYPLFSDTSFMRLRLAQELSFRGHVTEAYRVLGDRETPLFAELAFLGTVPDESAQREFAQWLKDRSPIARWALPWWAAHADSVDLAAFHGLLEQRMRTRSDTDHAQLRYDGAAWYAYELLVKRDSSAALRAFLSLPDTLCPDCYLDRLTRARLLMSRGNDRKALATLNEPLAAFLTPIEVMFALERGRAAARAGEGPAAAQAFDFVRRSWLHADPELRRLVGQATH
jgi:DNA-binding SARP family transcriptional activator/tetratricopeptide (TPR) repeat protein